MERTFDAVVGGLRLAKEAVAWLPVSVPGLAPALEVALKLAEAAQETKEAKDGCRALAERAARLSLGIYEQLKRRGPDVDMSCENEYIGDLISALGAIEALMRRRGKMGVIKAFLRRDELLDEVKRLGTQLDDAFRLYSAQDSIANRQDMKQITDVVMRLDQHAENEERRAEIVLGQLCELTQRVSMSTVEFDQDGTMILRHEDIEYVKELNDSEAIDSWTQYRLTMVGPYDAEYPCPRPKDPDRVIKYLGRIKKTGKKVIIKKFPRQDEEFKKNLQRAKTYLQRSKASPNPHVAFMAGYSGSDVQYGFLAIEETQPYGEFFEDLQGTDRYLHIIELAQDMQSAFNYLRDLAVFPDRPGNELERAEGLYLTADGTIRWDLDTWNGDGLPYRAKLADFTVDLWASPEIVNSINLRRLETLLESQDPIERAATLIIIWDAVQEFTYIERDDWSIYAYDEDIPWVGKCIDCQGPFNVWTPEDGVVDSPDDTVEYLRNHSPAALQPFDEYAPDTDHEIGPEPYVIWERTQPQALEGATKIIGPAMTMPGGRWRRYAVLDMEYMVQLVVHQDFTESIPCRNFFLNGAIDLDISRYAEGFTDASISTARQVDFITTSHLVRLSPTPIGKPPSQLYFYELIHTHETVKDFDTPWGYWWTSPEPIPEFPDQDASRSARLEFSRKYDMDLVYAGPNLRKLGWHQTLAGFVFRIEVAVVMETHQLTMDERWLLEEVEQNLEEAYVLYSKEEPEDVRERVRCKRKRIEDAEQQGWRTAKIRRYE
ncbi:hypothetical protein C2E23DRAFT_39247 [Lenzites betulinus]|nr:hypothetical protein C2E23DRAFT_39247 [Lenzites betulinus]